MKVFRDINAIPSIPKPVLTIGSFDGVHLGHQQILNQINLLAKEHGGESVVITFHPHPRQIIYPKDNSLTLLNTLNEKLYLLEKAGIDNVVVVPFSIEFSQQNPKEYIEKFLIEKFQPAFIVIGYDHRFGLNREGNIFLLNQYQEAHEFEVVEIQKHELENIAISSTTIRKSIQAHEIEKANALLGSPYLISGQVISGKQLGKELGFPTANLKIENKHKLIPGEGIYAVRILHQERTFDGMLYIGNRPSLNDNDAQSIEINIFDFNEMIYHEFIIVQVLSYVRADQKYDSMDALKAQLSLDKKMVQAILKENK